MFCAGLLLSIADLLNSLDCGRNTYPLTKSLPRAGSNTTAATRGSFKRRGSRGDIPARLHTLTLQNAHPS